MDAPLNNTQNQQHVHLIKEISLTNAAKIFVLTRYFQLRGYPTFSGPIKVSKTSLTAAETTRKR